MGDGPLVSGSLNCSIATGKDDASGRIRLMTS
jgi:hypothetical protein